MDENKDMQNVSEETEEITETTQETVEETVASENTADDVNTEADENKESEDEDFAVVYSEENETEEQPKAKKSIKGIVIGVVAAIIVILAAFFAIKNMGGSTEGTGNLYSRGFATIKGNYVYHVNFSDYKMYKTNLKTGESQCVTDDYAVYISNYKNDIYYLGYTINENSQSFDYQFKKYSENGDSTVIANGELTDLQYSGDYVYYLESVPELYSGYSSRIYRVSLAGGAEPELVSDVLCVSYYVDGSDLYYCDVQTTGFMKVDLESTVKYIKENPLADGATRSSEELGAEKVIDSIVTCIARAGDKLFYVDAQSGYVLTTYDIKTGETAPVNGGLKTGAINIYGDYLYYFDYSDYAVYRMNLDGSNVVKVTGPGYGYMSLSHDKFMTMEFTDDYRQYMTVCDLDGNVLLEIGLPEEEEEFYDDSALPETDGEAEGEFDGDADAEENGEADGNDEGVDTTVDTEE